jgi:hypothetical protein
MVELREHTSSVAAVFADGGEARADVLIGRTACTRRYGD